MSPFDSHRVLVAGDGRSLLTALADAGHRAFALDGASPEAAVRSVRPAVVVDLAGSLALVEAAERGSVQRYVAVSLDAAVEDAVMAAQQMQGVVLRGGPDVPVDALLAAIDHGWGVYDDPRTVTAWPTQPDPSSGGRRSSRASAP